MAAHDAVVVGAGPNGLAAAITLAEAGVRVLVLEAEPTVGGACRSAQLTLPGFVHDIGSGIHPFAYFSPFLRSLPLAEYGLEWVRADAASAHPLADARAVLLEVSAAATAKQLGGDAERYRSLFAPAADALKRAIEQSNVFALAPHLGTLARLGLAGLRSAEGFVGANFREEATRALIAGMAGHSMLPLNTRGTAAIALALLVTGNAGAWAFPRGGAQRLSDAMARYLESLGGAIETGVRVRRLDELPAARAVLFDVTPRQLLAICGERLPPRYARELQRFRYGLAAFKADWALSEAVPWSAPEVRRAATLHIGGSFEEIAASERAAASGRAPEAPFVIAAQHSLFDPTRAPAGRHTLWAYCHVPAGCEVDMLDRMERQIERFAPGFRETIVGRSVLPPRALEALNANLVDGTILGGAPDLWQTFVRPTFRYFATPLRGVYLCSASTPPGPGVHGMCGHWAARVALRSTFGVGARQRERQR